MEDDQKVAPEDQADGAPEEPAPGPVIANAGVAEASMKASEG